MEIITNLPPDQTLPRLHITSEEKSKLNQWPIKALGDLAHVPLFDVISNP